MFSQIVFALCAVSLAHAEYSAQQKEELSVKILDVRRSVDFSVKIAKIELEMQLYGAQASEISAAKDDQAKTCIQGVTEAAVNSQAAVLDSTVGKSVPELKSLVNVVMEDSKQDSDWDKVKTFLASFNLEQYKKETKKEFLSKLEAWINLQETDMKSCIKQ